MTPDRSLGNVQSYRASPEGLWRWERAAETSRTQEEAETLFWGKRLGIRKYHLLQMEPSVAV